MHVNRRSAVMARHFIAHSPGAFGAILMLLPRVTNAIVGASAHARSAAGDYMPGNCNRGEWSRVRRFVTVRW